MEKEKKKGKLKWVIIAIVAVVVVFAIASGGDDDSDEVAKKTGQVETEQTSSDAKEDNKSESEEKSEFKVGDVVETSDLKISYLSAKKYKTDNEFMQPKKGNVYYC